MKTYVLILALFLIQVASGQIPSKQEEVKKIQTGFLYFTEPYFVTFVALKGNDTCRSLNDFDTKKLEIGYIFPNRIVGLDTLRKYVKKSNCITP